MAGLFLAGLVLMLSPAFTKVSTIWETSKPPEEVNRGSFLKGFVYLEGMEFMCEINGRKQITRGNE
jgi:hypothetical protein